MAKTKKYKIHFGGKEVDASDYQNEIFNEIEYGYENIIINSAAGSSKTTTIINACKYIPEDKRIMFVAFNNEIVKEIKEKIQNNGVHVTTFHSLGLKILLENGYRIKTKSDNQWSDGDTLLDEYKYNTYTSQHINDYSETLHTLSKKSEQSLYRRNIHNLVSLSRYYLIFKPNEIESLAKNYGYTLFGDECALTKEILLWGMSNLSTMDYTDLIWLPNVLNLPTKRYLYDFIFIDEAQDTSIAQQSLIKKCFKRNTRFVAVGDNAQKINTWCGASEMAIENLKRDGRFKELSLPISYRCPKRIVEFAKAYSDNIMASDSAIDGEIRYDVSVNEPIRGDIVLCRNTSPLIELHLKYHRFNKKSRIRGNDEIMEKYISLIDEFKECMFIDRGMNTTTGLLPKLYMKLIRNIEKSTGNNAMTFEEAVLLNENLLLYDEICGISILSEGLLKVDELRDKINVIFGNTRDADIELMTVHKSKGLEADNVYILCPSLLPSKYAKTEWEVKSEQNLCYVAYTRAKKTLNFMTEDKYKGVSGNMFTSENIINDIKEKQRLLENGMPYQPEVKEDKNKKNIQKRKMLLSKLGTDDSHEDNTGTINDSKIRITASSKKAGNRFRHFME